MKSLWLILFSFILFSRTQAALKYAAKSPTIEEVRSVKDSLIPTVLAMNGVAGIAITACDTETGLAFYKTQRENYISREHEWCLNLFAGDMKTLVALEALFPPKTRLNRVLVSVDLLED